jgi:predicted O-methyltransferase YrrM
MKPLDFVARIADIVLSPLTVVGAVWLKAIRRSGLRRMKLSRRILQAVGIMPVRDHYYEPLINPTLLRTSLREERILPGVDLNPELQLDILNRFEFADELMRLPINKPPGPPAFYYHNAAYGPGDSEYLYSMIRLFKPARMIEVGCGFSTLIARAAIAANSVEDPAYRCEHICVEPYEQPWLEALGVRCIREVVERSSAEVFQALEANDILFIDSSHVIRPQGDVLYLYQNVVPRLAPGVLIHVHDIFTPRDYRDDWVREDKVLWNEQYLLESLLCYNDRIEVIGALNYLSHSHRARLAEKCPIYRNEAESLEPGAFWMRIPVGSPTQTVDPIAYQ